LLGANQPACAQTRYFPRPGTLDAMSETLHEGDGVELDGEPGRRTTRVGIKGPLRGEIPGVDLAACCCASGSARRRRATT
jgi:hypothetical protein